ncbi:MAG: MarR family transcriptional regulator [Dehalococcoidia bacterium]
MTQALAEDAIEKAAYHLAFATTMFDPLRFRAWAELGLTTAQLRVMFLLRDMPGVTAGELATRLKVTPPTISGIVDRLVKLELVRREFDPADRRLVRNHLTADGTAACSRLERGAELFTHRIMSEMSPEDLEALTRGLEAFIGATRLVERIDPDLAQRAWAGEKP